METSSRRPVCLIAITAQRFSSEFGEAVLASARSRGEDVAIGLILDPDAPDEVAERLAEAGFLGERLMHEVRDTMDREYRERGQEHLVALATRASDLGLRVETRTARGPFVQTVREEAVTCHAVRVVVAQLSASPLARAIFGSETARLRREVGCPVEVFDLAGHPVAPRSGTP